MDHVCGVALSHARPQGFRTSERACDSLLAVLTLPRDLAEHGSCGLVGSGCIRKDAMNRRSSGHQIAEHRREPCQLDLRVSVGEESSDVGAVQHRDRLVVADDRNVEHRFEDPELRGEQPVHGRLRRIRVVADCLDGRRCVSALEEKGPGGVDHRGPCTAGARLRRSLVGIPGLDISIHSCESNTIETRVKLSNQGIIIRSGAGTFSDPDGFTWEADQHG